MQIINLFQLLDFQQNQNHLPDQQLIFCILRNYNLILFQIDPTTQNSINPYFNSKTMKSRSKSRKRKINPNIDSHPDSDSFLDEQQKATYNLFNVSDFNDQTHYEANFNCIFDMFQSVDLDSKTQKQSKNSQNHLYLNKFSSTVRETSKYRNKNFDKDKNMIQQSKFLIKLYESHTQQDSSKSPTLRIRKQKILDKISTKNRKNPTYKAFKSDLVFVGQNHHCESMIATNEKYKKLETFLNLKNNQNSLIFKKDQKLKDRKKLSDITVSSPIKKLQGFNEQTLNNIRTLSPQVKPHSILSECARIHRLESLYSVRPLSKTTLGPCSELKKRGQEMISPKLMEKSNGKELSKTLRFNRTKQLQPSRYNETKKRKVFF